MRTETLRLAREAREGLITGADPAAVLLPLASRCDELAAELAVRAHDGTVRSLGEALVAVLRGRPGGQHRIAPALAVWLASQADRGAVALLVDALDETSLQPRLFLLDTLGSWLEGHADPDTDPPLPCTGPGGAAAPGRVLLTARLAAHPGVDLPGSFRVVELVPLEPAEVTAMVQAWPLHDAGRSQLLRRLVDPAVAGLVRVPLLLALLCDLAQETEGLPRTRADLYAQALRRFLSREQAGRRHFSDSAGAERLELRQSRRADVDALIHALKPIAFAFATAPFGWADRMLPSQLTAALRRADPKLAAFDGEAEHLVHSLASDAGILVPASDPSRGKDPPYLFVHRTFAEYLVAAYLAEQPDGGWQAVVDAHLWFDAEWEQVWPLVGGRPEPQRLLEYLLHQPMDPLHHALGVAARVVAELPDPPPRLTTDAIREAAERLLELVYTPLADEAWQGLGVMAAKLPDAVLPPLLDIASNAENPDVRRAAVEALAGRPGDSVTAALVERLGDWAYVVRESAVWALAGRPGESVTQALVERLGDLNRGVRRAAIGALAGRPGELGAAALERLNNQNDVQVKLLSCESLKVLAYSVRQQDVQAGRTLMSTLDLLTRELSDEARHPYAREGSDDAR